jgi:hypothetical protein
VLLQPLGSQRVAKVGSALRYNIALTEASFSVGGDASPLLAGLAVNRRIEELELEKADFDLCALTVMLNENHTLKRLTLSNCVVSGTEVPNMIADFRDALSQTALREVSLDNVRVSPEMVEVLMCPTSQIVSLSLGCMVGLSVASLSGASLARNSRLERLRVHCPARTRLELAGVRELRIGLAGSRSLRSLQVWWFDIDAPDVCAELVAALRESRLRDFCSRCLPQRARIDREELGRQWGFQLSRLVAESDSLQRLDVAGNLIGPEGGRLLHQALQSNTSLVELRCDDNNFDVADMDAIHNLTLCNRLVPGWVERACLLPSWLLVAGLRDKVAWFAFAREVGFTQEAVGINHCPRPGWSEHSAAKFAAGMRAVRPDFA